MDHPLARALLEVADFDFLTAVRARWRIVWLAFRRRARMRGAVVADGGEIRTGR